VLQFYLERMAGKGLRVFWAAERAYDLLADQRELNDHLRKQPPHELADIIKVLASYEAEYQVEAVVPASIVLLNLLPDIPKRKRSVFDFFNENTIVASVVLRLLRRIDSPEAIAAATKEILPSLDSLSSQLQLIRIVGHEENIGNELVTFDASRKFESELRRRIRHTSLGDLTREHELFRLLTWIKATSSATEPSFDIPVEKPIAGAILKAALTEIRSQESGTRSIKTEQVLYWESLVELLGGESGVEALIQVCMDEEDTDIVTARNLAQKYLSGWRPERY